MHWWLRPGPCGTPPLPNGNLNGNRWEEAGGQGLPGWTWGRGPGWLWGGGSAQPQSELPLGEVRGRSKTLRQPFTEPGAGVCFVLFFNIFGGNFLGKGRQYHPHRNHLHGEKEMKTLILYGIFLQMTGLSQYLRALIFNSFVHITSICSFHWIKWWFPPGYNLPLLCFRSKRQPHPAESLDALADTLCSPSPANRAF